MEEPSSDTNGSSKSKRMEPFEPVWLLKDILKFQESISPEISLAPVIGDVTLKTMIAIKVTKSYFTIFLDIATAFLDDNLKEEIYMTTPEGLREFLNENLDGQCVVLHKSIYGLVQSARQY